MQNKKDWLNSFIEKNAWGLLVALIGISIAYAMLSSKVQAQGEKIIDIQQAQVLIIQNQKDIIKLQTIQDNLIIDISEIKISVKEVSDDVKILLQR